MTEREEMEVNIGRQVSKLLRDHFGRGPRSTYVQVKPPFITVYLREFLAPIERTLWPRKGAEGIEQLRDDMMKEMRSPIRTVMEAETNHMLKDLYYDWHLQEHEPANGMIWGILDPGEEHQEPFPWPRKMNQDLVEQKIAGLSNQTGKKSEKLSMYWLGKNKLLVEQGGILGQMEQTLIENGDEKMLEIRKRKLSKEVFTKKILQVFLQRKVQDVFVGSNVREDIEYLIICLQKETTNKGI